MKRKIKKKIRKRIMSRSKSMMLTVSIVPLNLLLNLAPTHLPNPTLLLTLASALPKNLIQARWLTQGK